MPKINLQIPHFLKDKFFADAIGSHKSHFSIIASGEKALSNERIAKLAGAVRAAQAYLDDYHDFLLSQLPDSQEDDEYDLIERDTCKAIYAELKKS